MPEDLIIIVILILYVERSRDYHDNVNYLEHYRDKEN